MGLIRKHSRHVRWTDGEEAIIRQKYPSAAWPEILAALPRRTRGTISTKASLMRVYRPAPPARSPAEIREAKRVAAAEKRASDPAGNRAYQMARYNSDIEAGRAKLRAYQRRRFFWLKAQRLKKPGRANYRQIAAMWKAQRGRCALTGVKMDRTAELDHCHPRSRGGGDQIENLQWLSYEANRAKGTLTNEEFRALCLMVSNHG